MRPVKRHRTGRMYQPRRSGLRAGFPVLTAGPVESYFKPNAVGAPTLPALSVHLPLTEALALSGPE